jgi:uncharacterized protein (DUF362 family)
MTSCKGITRRDFVKMTAAGACYPFLRPLVGQAETATKSSLFWVTEIPDQPFIKRRNTLFHAGVDTLLTLMGNNGLKFYRSLDTGTLSGPSGLIAQDDVVLIKVNAQWKYRGCTNSDVVRGLIQRILEHPDGFRGEVVIMENGQGRGSLNCDTSSSYNGDTTVQANANNPSHSFLYLVNNIFRNRLVSAFLLDPVRGNFIGVGDHASNGYRYYENVSYPCFTTARGHRVELLEGIWTGAGYSQNLKLINVPVLKHHDENGSEITASLKHFYGVVSMSDGQSGFRHYAGLGETCGKVIASVRTPVLNIIDAIWVSQKSLSGYPSETTYRANQLLASQDPVALDYFAAKYILYPIDNNPRHHPTFPGIDDWLTDAQDTINTRGGLYDPANGMQVWLATKNEQDMAVFRSASLNGAYPWKLKKLDPCSFKARARKS